MTYIQPNNRINILNLAIAGLAFLSLVGIFCLVALYNNIVNLNHNIAAAKTELDSIGSNNTTLNNQVIAALGNVQSANMAAGDGLVADNHPQYFTQSWPIASQ